MIRKHLGYARLAIKNSMEFKTSFYAGSIIPIFQIVILVIMWRLIFSISESGLMGGLGLNEMLLYVIIMIVVSETIIIGKLTQGEIRRGDIVKDFARPVKHNLRVFITRYTIRILRMLPLIPVVIVTIWYLGLPISTHWLTWILFFISWGLATVLMFFLAQAFAAISFWSNAIGNMRWTFGLLNGFFGGGFLPLTMFPVLLQQVLNFLPFMYTVFVPLFILLEKYSLQESLWRVGVQIIWIGIAALILRFVWKKGLKRFDAQGG